MREFSQAAQERLLRSRVLVHGDGPSADLCVLYLAAAGVGSIHLSARMESAGDVVRRAGALNPDTRTSAGAPGAAPDYVIDFPRAADRATARRIADALLEGTPYVTCLLAAGAAVVKRYGEGDACPACVLRAAGLGRRAPVDARDAGVGGPCAAGIATLDLAGIAAGPAAAVVLDPRGGRFDDLEVRPVRGCPSCGELAIRRPSP